MKSFILTWFSSSFDKDLTDTGEDSKLIHRWIWAKVCTAPPRYLLLFIAKNKYTSEGRVWLSAWLKIHCTLWLIFACIGQIRNYLTFFTNFWPRMTFGDQLSRKTDVKGVIKYYLLVYYLPTSNKDRNLKFQDFRPQVARGCLREKNSCFIQGYKIIIYFYLKILNTDLTQLFHIVSDFWFSKRPSPFMKFHQRLFSTKFENDENKIGR